MNEPRLLTEDPSAAYLSPPAATVRKLTFGHVRLGTRRRYDRKALDMNGHDRRASARPGTDGQL